MSNVLMHPGIFMILCGFIAVFVPKIVRQAMQIICPIVAFILAWGMPLGTDEVLHLFGYDFHYMFLSQKNIMFLMIFTLVAVFAGFYSSYAGDRLGAFASMGYAGGAAGVVLAGDWFSLIFFWEFMAITSTLLIWGSHTKRATAAGFRYLLVHMLGGNMLLFGIVIKVTQGSLMISNLTDGPHDLAFWLIFLGMAVNAAIVPLHAWAPDAYPESTLGGGAYVSGFTTKLAVLCICCVFAGWQPLIILGLIMIFYGACLAIIENDMRRLLSYHIISQLGFMIADIGIGTEFAQDAAYALAFGNVLYKSLLFMCAGAIIYATGIRKINKLGRLAKKMPLTCIVFFVAAFSITGVPGFAGFTCKSLSMACAEEAGLEWVATLMMLGSIGTALSIPIKMGYFIFFGEERNIEVKPYPVVMKIGMVLGAIACILAGVLPGRVYDLLPFATDYTPYTISHVLEYAQLLPAAFLAFLMYLPNMEPHTALTIDLDWFYRKPFAICYAALSKALFAFQNFCGGIGRKVYHFLQVTTNDPYAFLHMSPKNELSDERQDHMRYKEDAYRSRIGDGMIWVMGSVIVIAVYLLVVMRR